MIPTTNTPNLDNTPEGSAFSSSSSPTGTLPTSSNATGDPYGAGSAYAAAYPTAPIAGQPEPKPLSLTSFWLGIASVVFSFTLFVPIAAIVLGFLARTREPTGRMYAIWGIVLGFVMAVGWALALVAAGGIALAALPFFAFI